MSHHLRGLLPLLISNCTTASEMYFLTSLLHPHIVNTFRHVGLSSPYLMQSG